MVEESAINSSTPGMECLLSGSGGVFIIRLLTQKKPSPSYTRGRFFKSEMRLSYKSNNKVTGSSNNCFTFTKKVTEVLPSMMRWS